MRHFAPVFILLFLTSHASCSFISDLMRFPGPKISEMNAYASKTGEIQIFKDLDGYYVYADLASSTSTGKVGNDTVKMMLSLSNNDVLLIDSCLDFQKYNCPYYHCTKDSRKPQTVNYPYFTASAVQASASVYLDYAYWKLQEKAFLATKCSTDRNESIGKNRYGVIGLGAQGSSKNNFLKNKLFSISFGPDLQNGTLTFSVNEEYTYYSVGSLKASSNWIVPIHGSIQMLPYKTQFKGSLAFDINAKALGFPLGYFLKVVQYLTFTQWKTPISCTDTNFQPTCNYAGYIKDLPSLFIATGQGKVDFTIPPELYVLNAKSQDDYVDSIILNIQAIDSSLTGESYVTPDYDNTIIFDARTMSSYYIVFNAAGSANNIQIYKAKIHPDSWAKLIYIGIGSVVLALIIGCFVVWMKKRKARATSQTSLISGESSRNSVQPVISTYDYQQKDDPAGSQNNYDYQKQPQESIQYAPPLNAVYE